MDFKIEIKENKCFMDFKIEIKENKALILFDDPPTGYLVSVSDPIEFSLKIYKTILKHYKKVGDTARFEKLKLKGFNYLDYISKI
jgi:hypothetical protein